ncbi:MAG TPA: cytochrome c3 family protein [Rhodocyclaceae bacterium]
MRTLPRIAGALARSLVILMALAAVPAAAQNISGSGSFNHATVGYTLDGAHVRERCESCHRQGLFRGTPRDCAGCHRSGGRAPGKTPSHVPTTTACDACHLTSNWSISTFRHQPAQGVSVGSCAICHNGSSAHGKPANHIVTNAACDSCHRSTAWTPAGYTHALATPGSCQSCHNGIRATGRSIRHIPTSTSCEQCHAIGSAFAPTTTSTATLHSAMSGPVAAGNCAMCHNGNYTAQNAQAKPASHIPTSEQCDSCHSSTTTWATASFDHGSLSPPATGICSSCHGTSALGKSSSHVPTNLQCDLCHVGFTAFKPAQMNHFSSAAQCVGCHGGTYVSAGARTKPVSHIPTTGQCDACHASTTGWTPAAMNHAGTAGKCIGCHSGGFLAQNAQVKHATHVATTAQCDTCHKSTTTWATRIFDHSSATPAVAGRCSSCHNSVNALGKPTTHVPTSAQCDSCHSGFAAFRPARMNHAGTAGQCASCHNGNYAFANADGRPANHIPTSASCDSCHTGGFTAWRPATMNHAGTTGLCSACHSGTYLAMNAQAKPPTHVATTAQCDSCHKSTTTWASATFNHATAVPAVAGRCSSCHGVNALGKPTNHVPTTVQCDSCHGNFTAFAPATMNHAATTGQCASCHNGTYLFAGALAKPGNHVPTTAQCDTCHRSTSSWTGAAFTHGPSAVGTCSTCHNGSTSAPAKSGAHIPTGLQCDNCHTNYTAFVPATMNHAGLAGQCQSCHGGSHTAVGALAKSTSHVPTSVQCDVCHVNGFLSFAPGRMNHAATAAPVAAGNCSTCHGGAYVSQNALAKPATHVATTAQCDSCHQSTTSWATATFNHATASPPVAGRCASCHGVSALGKQANHVPTAAQCDSCHTGFVAFAPANMNHGATSAPVAAGNCATCHGGAYVGQGARAKPATHIVTTQSCDACHTSTAWLPTSFSHTGVAPGACATCHNGTAARGKPAAGHVPTTAACDTCHTNFVGFAPAVMNHAATTGPVAAANCSTCHSGAYLTINAQVKPATHVATTAQCDTCHTSTSSWATATFNHVAASPPVVGRCATCHNSVTALGKPTTHVPTTAQCDICHSGFSAFRPAPMNHAATTGPIAAGNCSACHNGGYTAVNARAKPATHIPTVGQCDSCHSNTSAWAPATMNHAGTAGQCSSCHSGAYLAQNALAKPPTHIATTAQCDSCHNSTTSWATATFNHGTASPPVAGRCASCHGISALGKPPTHVPTTAQCDTCHKNFTAFAPATMSHSATTGPLAAGNCASCHGGAYVSAGAVAKTATHLVTTQSCDVCHTTTAWKPTSFAHTGVTPGSCASCHNGTTAVGKPGVHIPTTLACDACHRTSGWLPLITPFAHTGVAAGSCASCHSPSFPNITVKPTSHIPTSAACDACHHSFTAWLPVTYNHVGIAANSCQTCHGGAYANITVKPANHVPTTSPAGSVGNECSLCHTSTTNWLTGRMNHGTMQTGCRLCHLTGAPYQGTMDKKSTTHEQMGTKDCSSSGCHRPLGTRGSPYTRWD